MEPFLSRCFEQRIRPWLGSSAAMPGGREAFEAVLSKPPGANQVRLGDDFTITVQEVDIRIGQVTRILESAQFHSWEEPPDGEPPGATTLVLVPAETNKVTMQRDAGDD